MKTTKKNKNGKQPTKKWKTNQSTIINLIGCDTIVNSPSLVLGIMFQQNNLSSLFQKSWIGRKGE